MPIAKIRWKISRLDFLGLRQHPPHWLSSKGPNCQRGGLLISAGAIVGHFEEKTPREGHQGGLVLARQFPDSPGICNAEETGLSGFHCRDHSHYSLYQAPRISTCSLDWKKQLKGRYFWSDAVIAAAESWLDGQPSEFFFFEWPAKIRATG